MGVHKLVIVSNRLPISITKTNGVLEFTASSGGLATAMSSLDNNSSDRIWVGWPGIAADDLTVTERATITKKLKRQGCYPVFLSRKQLHLFYEGYANDTIWPLFHYFQSLAVHRDDYWQAYKQANDVFCKTVTELAATDATIWIHDYHLMLLPSLLRTTRPNSSIGFFLHIPFPSSEIFRLLPERHGLLAGLFGADLVGFHTYDYARHFLSSALRLFGYESNNGSLDIDSRIVKTDIFPIGIDYPKFVWQSAQPATQLELTKLDRHYAGRKVILSMDRLDYSKGIINRLEAYELFLEQNPKYHKRVVLVMIAVPSRTEVAAYKTLRESIERTVGRINGEYATSDWSPISYQFKNLSFKQVFALQARADIALITPLRDGMNLVAKEYIASKQQREGVLILSELAGAADEFPESLIVNPNDRAAISRSIVTALQMPKSLQRQNLATMQRRLSEYDVKHWAKDFLEQLSAARQAQTQLNSKMLTPQTEQQIVNAFTNAHHRLLLLDYDGTLRSFVNSPDPAQAAPSQKLLNTLGRLANKHTQVCIVSGRTQNALDMWFHDIPLTLIAEHGAWVKQSNTWTKAPVDFEPYKQRILPILSRYAERTPGALVEEKTCALVWHYRNVPTELAYVRNASLSHELQKLVTGTDIEVFNGDKILEIKPRTIHKGHIVRSLLAENPSDFVMAIGDDYTDEDMFKALPDNAYTIKVGLGDTHARHQVVSVSTVRSLLQALTRLTQNRAHPHQISPGENCFIRRKHSSKLR
jgi:trehalose 6-phosphate synthase/phosphatase